MPACSVGQGAVFCGVEGLHVTLTGRAAEVFVDVTTALDVVAALV